MLGDDGPGDGDIVPDHRSQMPLRIGAIFILMFTSGFGALAPNMFKRIEGFTTSLIFRLAKSYAAGVVLATGVIHMLPPAFEALGDGFGPDVDFPFAALFTLGSMIMTLMIEQMAGEYFQRLHSNMLEPSTSVQIFEEGEEEGEGEEQQENEIVETSQTPIIPNKRKSDLKVSLMEGNEPKLDQKQQQPAATTHRHSKEHRHSRDGGGGGGGHSHGHMDVLAKMDVNRHARSFVIAHVLEMGIAFHSVIIGITLGVTTKLSRLQALLAALVFHQFFEGFALGSSIMEANMKSMTYPIVMGIIFALTTPTGVAIGIGISSFYEEDSKTALLTQGTFDAVSAGILIYMALVDLVSEEFRDLVMAGKHAPNLRLKMLGALAFGSSCMAVLALWA